MDRDDLNASFSFVNEAKYEAETSAPPVRRGTPVWVTILLAVSTFAAGIAAFLVYERFVTGRAPGQVAHVQAAPMPVASAPVPPVPAAPARSAVARPQVPVAPVVRQETRRPAKPTVAAVLEDAPAEPKESLSVADAKSLLESRQIVSRSSGYFVETEADVRSKLAMLRSRADEFNGAADKLHAAETLEGLEQEVSMANAAITNHNIEMGQFTAIWRRGILFHGVNSVENAAYEQLKATRDQLVRNRDTNLVPNRDALRRQAGGRLPQLTQAFQKKKDAALAGLDQTRKAIAGTFASYEVLPRNPEVKAALARIGQRELRPSDDFLQDVKEFTEFERSVGQKPTFNRP